MNNPGGSNRTWPFLRLSDCRLVLAIVIWSASAGAQDLSYRSPFLRIEMAADQPNFRTFAVDSLGKNKLDVNVMLPLAASESRYVASRNGQTVEYRVRGENSPAWTFTFGEQGLTIRSNYSPNTPPHALVFNFDPKGSHATLLGLFTDEGEIRLPALLHFPDRGTLRITTATKAVALGYDALRFRDNFIRVSFPAADKYHQKVECRLEVATVYPNVARFEGDSRYDGFRRDFLNILQLNPRRRALANNSASDAVAFTLFEYSMMAPYMPPLADGLSALDILRQTLDRYVGGMKGYGMWDHDNSADTKYDFLDTYPSLVVTSADYVQASHDQAWLKRNYSAIKSWADKMIEFDTDGDGLMEYPLSGNSGSWPEKVTIRPSNWWDTIGFGHKDAYSNALPYVAFKDMAELSNEAGHGPDSRVYEKRAEKIKAVYYRTFYDPATGVLAGWKSADGKLHDYYFLFINGMAVTYGLVTHQQGNAIWDKLTAKMKEVGYNRFDLGLPGNLIPIRKEDYTDLRKEFGGPEKADGSDGFQIYENGGATACYAYFTIQALRELGRDKEADAILFPMLKAFEDGGFQGSNADGDTYDWKAWDGAPHGYEGLLVDGYLTLLAAMPADTKKP
jgi:hypothetical protein